MTLMLQFFYHSKQQKYEVQLVISLDIRLFRHYCLFFQANDLDYHDNMLPSNKMLNEESKLLLIYYSMKRKSEQIYPQVLGNLHKNKKNKTFHCVLQIHPPQKSPKPFIPESIAQRIFDDLFQKAINQIQQRAEARYLQSVIDKCQVFLRNLINQKNSEIEIKKEEFQLLQNQPLKSSKDPIWGFNKKIIFKRTKQQERSKIQSDGSHKVLNEIKNIQKQSFIKNETKLVPLFISEPRNETEQKLEDYLRKKRINESLMQKSKDLLYKNTKGQKEKATSLTNGKYQSKKINYRKQQQKSIIVSIKNDRPKEKSFKTQSDSLSSQLSFVSYKKINRVQQKTIKKLPQVLKKTHKKGRLIRNELTNQ